MNNNVLDEQFRPQREGPVRCREKLGGLSRVGTKGRPFVPPSEPDVRVSPHPAQASHQELVLTPGFFSLDDSCLKLLDVAVDLLPINGVPVNRSGAAQACFSLQGFASLHFH